MLFVLVYDRRAGLLRQLEEFTPSDRLRAEERRLDLELDAAAHGRNHEIVILEAASNDDLRVTHGRYFKALKELEEMAAS